MAFVRAQTEWAIQCWMMIPPNLQGALNTRWENYGYGPNTFSQGLSASGNAPAQAYHSLFVVRLEDFPELVWLVNNAAMSKAWIWLRAREGVLKRLIQWHRDQIDDDFDKPEFKRLDWQVRPNAYVKHDTVKIKPAAALNWLANNANPAINLQVIR